MDATHTFSLPVDELREASRRAASDSRGGRLWESVEQGVTPSPWELLDLWHSEIPTTRIYDEARRRRLPNAHALETFSPLYLTNTCDAECKMCGMRRGNTALIRETAPPEVVREQLTTLARRGMHAVALLTGEYRIEQRQWAIGYVNEAVRHAIELGFRHILVNAGSYDSPEFLELLAEIDLDAVRSSGAKLSMSTFQETYDPEVYEKFMGHDAENPRAGFRRRLENFDRARAAGFGVANPGILVGLNADVAYEAAALTLHTLHLQDAGMEVYLSMPRLRRIAGDGGHHTIDDEAYVRLVALLSLALPNSKPVVTTRESASMQERLAPIVSVISAGSASVAPYTGDGARFPLETSQFEVIDQRPFEAILRDHQGRGIAFENFVEA